MYLLQQHGDILRDVDTFLLNEVSSVVTFVGFNFDKVDSRMFRPDAVHAYNYYR